MKCVFLLVVIGDVHTLLLYYKANHNKLFTHDLFRAVIHMSQFPYKVTAMMLTYIGASELPGWILVWTTLFCAAHSEFTQSLLSDAKRCSIRQRPLPDPFQFVLAVITQATPYNPYTKNFVKWTTPPFSFWSLSTESGSCFPLRTYRPLTSNANYYTVPLSQSSRPSAGSLSNRITSSACGTYFSEL
jgi:hypothetical protein